MWKRIVVTFALLAVLVQQQAHAQAIAVPAGAFTGSINAAVWNSIAANLARRGLAVSAAAAVSTETAIGLAASALSYGSAALTGVVGIATSPVWLTVAAGAGVLAGTAYLVSKNVQFSIATGAGTTPDGAPMPVSVTVGPTPAVTNFAYPGNANAGASGCTAGNHCWAAAVSQGAPMYRGSGCLSTQPCWALPMQPSSSVQPGISYFTIDGAAELYATTPQQFAQWYAFLTTPVNVGQPDLYGAVETWTLSSWSVVTNAGGTNYISVTITDTRTGSSDQAQWPDYTHQLTYPTAGTVQGLVNPVTGNLSTVAGLLTTAAQGQPASPVPQQVVADLANRLWRDAVAQPGYGGLPYDAVNPVTVGDVGVSTPSWSDMLTVPAPSGTTVIPISPTAGTGTGTGTGAGTGSGTGTGTNTGTAENDCTQFPNAAACQPLGTAPAAPPIPTSSAQVSMSPWSVGAADGVCPAPQVIEVLGTTVSLAWDPMCSFVQKVRPLVLAICALAAALIVAMGVSL